MWSYLARRILATIPVLLVVAVVVFLLVNLAPGDPAVVMAGDEARTEDIERIRLQLGLDRPLPVRFFEWVGQVARGDLGNSILNNRPVLGLILQRLEPTASLAFFSIIIAVGLAIPLGILAAWNAGRFIDRAVMVFAVLSFSFPVFLVGYLLMFAFSLNWRLLPVQGYTNLSEGLLPWLSNLVLPSVALGLVFSALLARMTRSTMIEVLNEDYIRTASAKGLATRPILFKHALKNAAIPIVTTIGVAFAALIGGVVVTESVFAIPGVGRLTIEAVLQRDYPVVQGVVLFAAFACVMVNLIIDLSYTFLDPRIRY
jgi:peptide/nickel transport system permease protein